MFGILRIVLVIGVALLAALFTMGNMTTVEVNFLITTYSIGLPLLVFVVLAAGLLVGYLLASFKTFRMSRAIRRLERQVQDAEAEVNNLRSIPIKDVH